LGAVVSVGERGIRAIQDSITSGSVGIIAELASEVSLTNRGLLCKVVAFSVDLVPNHVLYFCLRVILGYRPIILLNLYGPDAAASAFSKSPI
jgi:hypothetical protein